MSEKKIITVVGATGAQGGGLVRAICADPDGGFAARAITRNPESDKAKELAALGAEVVRADLDDEASLEAAFDGAYGAFCVTNYWEYFEPEREIQQARNMATAAERKGLKHVIWSTLDDTRKRVPLDDDRMPTLMGKYKVPHFDGKGEADAVFAEAGVPTTWLRTSFFWENLLGQGPTPGPDGVLQIVYPLGDAKMPGIAAEDIGRCAYGIFKAGDAYVGKTVGIAGEHVSGAEMAAGLSRALGREVRYRAVPPDVFRGFGFPGADDLGNMFQFKRDFEDEYRGSRNVELSRELNPDLQSFDDWIQRNKERIVVG